MNPDDEQRIRRNAEDSWEISVTYRHDAMLLLNEIDRLRHALDKSLKLQSHLLEACISARDVLISWIESEDCIDDSCFIPVLNSITNAIQKAEGPS